jgi:uncharacterized Zn finger protein
MTTELRTTIEVSDILAIELMCRKCGGKQSVPLTHWLVSSVRCGNCGAVWPIQSVDEHKRLMQLASSLAESSKINNAPDLPFEVRLELRAGKP